MLYPQSTMTSLAVLAGLCFREVKSFVPFPRRDSKRKNTLTMSPWPHDCSADAPTCTAYIADGAPVYSKHWIQASNQGIFFKKSKGCTPLFFFFCIQSLIMLCAICQWTFLWFDCDQTFQGLSCLKCRCFLKQTSGKKWVRSISSWNFWSRKFM